MASPPPSLEDEEYPGVYWVKAYWLLYNLKDGERMPRCQDLPANAFGHLRDATRVFAVTHPWLGRYSPDPDGIQVETLRSKLSSMAEQMLLDRKDVLFFDYLSLPQVHHESGKDDRTEEQLRRFKTALSGDLMGRIFLTSRVLVIDEVPKEAVSNTEFLNRGWCFFECVVASMNALARDLLWVSEKTKSEIARFRKLSAKFRETGELDELLQKFDTELKSKKFALKADAAMVRGFFVSLARSQRLIRAAAGGDWDGCESMLAQKADVIARDGWGRTALHAALLNARVSVVAQLLKNHCSAHAAAMKTLTNETSLELAKEGGSLECQVLLQHKFKHGSSVLDTEVEQVSSGGTASGNAGPSSSSSKPSTAKLLTIRAIENDEEGLREQLNRLSQPNEVDARDEHGISALYYAASLQHVELVRMLLKAGANPDLPCGGDQESASACATRLGFADVQELFATAHS
ncbi:unnamed protein product [Amoebophrya sp. A120]|nr:unnamed protein product [Amoebophrya sp. A120]|eukprot:GSA120T00005579001.1